MQLDDAWIVRELDAAPTEWEVMTDQRLAAVLAAIVAIDGTDHVLFTRRRDDLPEHGGQVAFPGGARDHADESPIECALRESHEEIGLAPEFVTVLGAIPNRTSSSFFRVHTIVGRVESAAIDALRPDAREVAAIFGVPVAELLDESRWEHREVRFRATETRRSPHFEHGSHTIWGLTGRLTLDLLERVAGPD